jgi:hypothetical protein
MTSIEQFEKVTPKVQSPEFEIAALFSEVVVSKNL